MMGIFGSDASESQMPAGLRVAGLGLLALVFGAVALWFIGGTFNVVVRWEKAQAKVISLNPEEKRSKWGAKRTEYRPMFEVTQANGSVVSARNELSYGSTSGVEVGTVVQVYHDGKGKAILDTFLSVYGFTLLFTGLGLLMVGSFVTRLIAYLRTGQ